ncbi:MAG: acyl-CoA dehydrogenase [Phycisphaerales bacterium]|nr:MAG: acyl-CoA dehydrogenase [Phycisphaerales bacterium]
MAADLKKLKGVSAKDAALVAEAESLMGAEPDSMGFIKNMFWGRIREDLVFPYPESTPEETAACDQLLARLHEYLQNEHPALQIDHEEETPDWVIKRLFELGVLGMTIPKQYGGLGLGITSYNRVLELIGMYCGSTAVIVSAHQSIGCKAVMLFGTDEQKQKWLPHLATDWLSAFCLSEPNVGCDAGGQETTCTVSEDGKFYILNGEKKWATSAALSGLFTVMCKQEMPNGKKAVSAVVCTPDMEGIHIYSKNRSKCGIRGTWQGRITFTNVRVPRENILYQEGKGLQVALTCLNYGRCTLSAGMLGGARKAMDQSIKWARTRYQFKQPLADFDAVKGRSARMAAYVYAMDAMLYMTTGMLDRHDEDHRVETAICKAFCSERGWDVVNDAMQIMGGESYMTENEIERIFRDTRINLIVEGSNDVMLPFIFGYGGKKLAEEHMLPIREMSKNPSNWFKPAFIKAAVPLGTEVFLGIRRRAPRVQSVHPSLRPHADRLGRLISEHTYQFKQMGKKYEGELLGLQAIQSRIADVAVWLHGWVCTLSKLDQQIRKGESGPEFERDKAAALHFFDIAETSCHQRWRELYESADGTMRQAADAAYAFSDTQPNSEFVIPEASPVAKGTGRKPKQEGIKQFPGDRVRSDAGAAV